MVNNKQQSTFPKQYQGYKNKEIKCTNNATATWNEEEWSMEINNIENSNTICTAYFERYEEEILNGAYPVLAKNLIPITINEENGKVTRADTTDTENPWYSYASQKWANAVILEDDYADPGAGKEIPEDKIESYFVWIPKYSYQLWDLGEYNGLTKIDETKPHTIPIRFGTTNTNDSKKGECTTPMNDDNTQGLSGEKGQCEVGDYMTHPAFISFNVNGLWVGKFETGYKSATNTTTAQVNPNDEADAKEKVSEVVIKPNEYSWRSIQLSKSHVVSYNYQRDLDSHMMKNTEWGAVAYLQHSLYGSRKSVRINNNLNYLTGYAAIKEPTTGLTLTNESCTTYPDNCNEYGKSDKGSDSNYSYNYFNKLSVMASTTNNYSGIYDMSGGAREMMMSAIATKTDANKLSIGRHNLYNSGFNGTLSCPTCEDNGINPNSSITEITDGIKLPETKYYDIYKYSEANNIINYTRRILGDATGEIGPFQSIIYKGTTTNAQEQTRHISSWYNNIAYYIYHGNPWFYRSAGVNYGTEAGIFAFSYESGKLNNNLTFRIVLAI